MAFRACIICTEDCTSPKCAAVSDAGAKAVDGDLNVFFVLKNILNVPSEVIETFLRKHGSPSDWGVNLCEACRQDYVSKAKRIHKEQCRIQAEAQQLQTRVAEHLARSKLTEGEQFVGPKPKGRGKKRGPSNVPGAVWIDVRNWVSENCEDKVRDDINAIIQAAGGIDNYIAQVQAEKNFRLLGSGHKLSEASHSSSTNGNTDTDGDGALPGPSSAMRRDQHQPNALGSVVLSDKNTVESNKVQSQEKRAAAAAALARFEKNRRPEANSKELLAARQAAFVKEQAKKELDAENEHDEDEEDTGPSPEIPVRVIDPASYAVKGVFFTCCEIGVNDPLPKVEVENKIREHLMKQLKNPKNLEEQSRTAALLIWSCNKPLDRVETAIETLCKYIGNIIENPTEEKYRKIRISNQVYKDRFAGIFGVDQLFTAASFDKTLLPNPDTWSNEEDEYWLFSPEDETTFTADLIDIRDMLKTTVPLKPKLHRNAQILRPQQLATRTELPDDFFTLSKDEIKREQALKTETAERALTLMTKAMRDREGITEYRIYRLAVMRIRFPDSAVLQGTFYVYEALSTVFNFVRENLVSSDLEFDLIRPGGQSFSEAEKKSNLLDLHLVPTSLLTFRMENVPESIANGELPLLNQDLLQDASA